MCAHLVQLGTLKLSIPFQTELVIDTNIRAVGTQTMVANTQTIVADTQVTVTNIEKTVAEMHRDMSVGQKDGSGQNSSVGESRFL